MKFVVLLVCVWLAGALARRDDRPIEINGLPECGACNLNNCDRPVDCVSGHVKDRCGCCDVCGKAEYELCHHEGVPVTDTIFLGRCGDNLGCSMRNDLDESFGPEAICYCEVEGALCGSDNITYDNLCELTASGARKGQSLVIQREGPCNEAPRLLSPPEHVKDMPGEAVALVCEARGFPIPTVEWTWTRVDGKTIYLPSDDLRVSVNMRGGPEKWQVTGWLQIMDLQEEHEGDYTCVAQNKHGIAEGTARIKVEKDRESKKPRKDRKNKRYNN